VTNFNLAQQNYENMNPFDNDESPCINCNMTEEIFQSGTGWVECGIIHKELDFKNTECLARDVKHGLFTEDDIPF